MAKVNASEMRLLLQAAIVFRVSVCLSAMSRALFGLTVAEESKANSAMQTYLRREDRRVSLQRDLCIQITGEKCMQLLLPVLWVFIAVDLVGEDLRRGLGLSGWSLFWAGSGWRGTLATHFSSSEPSRLPR